MNLPERGSILEGKPDATWRALDKLAQEKPDVNSGRWVLGDLSGASLQLEQIQPGLYLRHGRQVMATTGVQWPTTVNTATAKIGLLPFKCDPSNHFPLIIGMNSSGIPLTGRVQAGTNEILFYLMNLTPVTNADLTGAYLSFTAFYFTA